MKPRMEKTQNRGFSGGAKPDTRGACGPQASKSALRAVGGADLCGKNYGFIGFPSPPRDECPSGVVRWRETWSRKFAKVRVVSGKVHESPRKFAQIRPVNPRLFGLLRVRPILWQGRQQTRKPRRYGYSLL